MGAVLQLFIVVFVVVFSTSLCAALRDHFVTTWKTDNPGISNNTSITIPTAGLGYAYQVDWNNDGDFLDSEENTVHHGSITHDFGIAGTYTIRIKGAFPRIYFNNSGDKEKILSVDQWGSIQWKSMGRAFYGAKNLNVPATDTPDFSAVTDMQYMFYRATHADPDTTYWDTSSVTNMRYMFARTDNAKPNTTHWNTASVTNMSYMFYLAKSANPDTANWNTGNVTTMRSMFRGALLAAPDTHNWNTAAVTDMALMFRDAPLANPDTARWNLSNVRDLSYMFYKALLAAPDTRNWNTAAVSDMRYLFAWATAANPDTASWDTSNVTRMQYMFYKATASHPDATAWNIANVTNMTSMLTDVTLTTPRYDAMLHAFSIQNVQHGVVFHGGNATYCSGETARSTLIDTYGWQITDGGRDCRPITPDLAPDLQAVSDLGIANNDDNTSDRRPIFNLECMRTGNRLTLYSNRPFDNTQIATHVCDTPATVAVQADLLPLGMHHITYTDANTTHESLHSPILHLNIYNNPPMATDNNYTVAEDALLQGNVISDALADSDADGDFLHVNSWSSPLHGTLNTTNSDGAFSYTPDANFNGTDRFSYTVADANGAEATATITITVTAENDAPAVTQGTLIDVVMSEDAVPLPFSTLLSATDVDGDTLYWSISTAARHGNAFIESTGNTPEVTYVPHRNYVGTDTFQIALSDGTLTQYITVSLTIEAVNDLPVAHDDTASTYDNTAITLNVLNNDSDDDNDTLVLSSLSTPRYGQADIVGDVILYTAPQNMNVTDTFEYRIDDMQGGHATATVTVIVSTGDDDGVDEAEGIDNNHNGEDDRFESHVATMPLHETYVTLTAQDFTTFKNVDINTTPVTVTLKEAQTIVLPFGMVSFTLTDVGTSNDALLTFYYPKDERIEGYAKRLNDGSWHLLESTVTHTDTQSIVRFKITEGGIFDLDTIAAQITDPGGAYYRVNTHVAVPMSPLAHLLLVLLLALSSLTVLHATQKRLR